MQDLVSSLRLPCHTGLWWMSPGIPARPGVWLQPLLLPPRALCYPHPSQDRGAEPLGLAASLALTSRYSPGFLLSAFASSTPPNPQGVTFPSLLTAHCLPDWVQQWPHSCPPPGRGQSRFCIRACYGAAPGPQARRGTETVLNSEQANPQWKGPVRVKLVGSLLLGSEGE